jgi:hypothetical protein
MADTPPNLVARSQFPKSEALVAILEGSTRAEQQSAAAPAPSTSRPELPELPPRYTVDEGGDGEWSVTVRGEWDDRDDAGSLTREEAVDAAWDEFLAYDCDPEWRAFIQAMRAPEAAP